MRALAFVLLGSLAFCAPARADESADVQATISAQLEAFARDDAAAAYRFAAPAVRDKFTDAGAFLAMVKTAYPAVYRHRSAEFGAEARGGERVGQSVVFVDADNVVWTAVYLLTRQADDGWKIEGCALSRSDESSL
jgi:hypothetical protein